MPPLRFSKAITVSRLASTGVAAASFTKPQSKAGSRTEPIDPLPVAASHQNPRLLANCRMPKMSRERHKPNPIIRAPPKSAPPMVSHKPITLLTTPTSALLKAMDFSRNGVMSEPAKASPSLYRTIKPKKAIARGCEK